MASIGGKALVNSAIVGTVTGLAIRTGLRAAMQELDSIDALAGGGITGDVSAPVDRGITFLSSRQWQEVLDELGVDYPWYTRRANVLIDCDRLGHLMDQTIEIGEVVVQIKGETDPCHVMEAIHRLTSSTSPSFFGSHLPCVTLRPAIVRCQPLVSRACVCRGSSDEVFP